ncbi:MAG TPA: hypothetical protein PK054_10240 [Anaerohalosphaeraceae bacterium]|nr:hypothetical protein [Anaerohalosphaeraceae bacterium]HOL88479.1 hypothetical protein [Anaerohalosphaeraceae bacterium]HPP56944.1 hypothetical protein [Anaerohalosphaeraceae bacterium]
MMTKPVICRVIQSRPLRTSKASSEPEPYAPMSPSPFVRNRQIARQWTIQNPFRTKAPRGIWVDCWA